ncbi:hypothetical protein HDZ31DRAFT_47911 [Schizophyllum fasciatum]
MDGANLAPVSPLRDWQIQRPPRFHRVFGFILTTDALASFCEKKYPIPDDADMATIRGYIAALRAQIIQSMLCVELKLPLKTTLVYVDDKSKWFEYALVLADNLALYPEMRELPAPEVVDYIADLFGLVGADREPRWYKLV